MREFGVRHGVDVTSRIFWERACKSGYVLVGFGLCRGGFGMSHDKKAVCLGGLGFWISDFVDFARDL